MAAPQRAATGALSLTTAAPRRCACSFSTRAARSRPRHIYPATTAATAIHTIESRRRLDDSFPFYPRWHAITAAAPFSTTDSRSSSSSSTFSFARPDDATAFPSETERAILSAALGKGHVSAHGFTAAALAAGAADAGFNSSSSAAAAAAIHGGEFALVRWHLVTARGRLKERAKVLFDGEGGEGEGRLDVGKKIEMLCWERLMINRHIVHRWQEVSRSHSLSHTLRAYSDHVT